MRMTIQVPQAGTQTEVTFVEWFVSVGQYVAEGEVLGTIETEKAVVEIEAGTSGFVDELQADPGAAVNAGQILGYLSTNNDPNDPAARAAADATHASANVEPSLDDSPQTDAQVISALSPVRRRIAENLLWVTQNTARASTTVEVDFEAVVAVRTAHAERYRIQYGSSLTFLPFVAFAACRALEKIPEVTARMDIAANSWVVFRSVHLGIAVAWDKGLTVPVIRNAHQLTLTALAREIERSAGAVRTGSFKPADAQGGTLTLTNPGSLGSFMSQPITNRGETSILCIDGIEKRPVVLDDRIVPRYRGHLTLAFDHCLVDGSTALRFLSEVKSQLQCCNGSWLSD
jgi:pyruvate/2-oxoglutarate dehydrogenase complex dihydrolipoamide acyltransferase (E2) component